jgi:hypothetical protein
LSFGGVFIPRPREVSKASWNFVVHRLLSPV